MHTHLLIREKRSYRPRPFNVNALEFSLRHLRHVAPSFVCYSIFYYSYNNFWEMEI